MGADSVEFTSISEMFDHLGSVTPTIAVVGLVKPADEGSDSLHFSLTGCGNWLTVPGEMVERFQPLGKSACGDHVHDLVRLHIKRPDAGPASVLADLLTHHQAVNAGGTMAAWGDPDCVPPKQWNASQGRCV